MTEEGPASVADGIAYEEREAVAVFENESSLNAAVDALMLAGLRQDAEILEILKRHGGRDAHFHVVSRTWGVADRPLYDVNPDPFLRE